MAVVLVTRRWALRKDLILAAALAVAIGLLVGRVVQGKYELIWDLPLASESIPRIPCLRVTVPLGVLATVVPIWGILRPSLAGDKEVPLVETSQFMVMVPGAHQQPAIDGS